VDEYLKDFSPRAAYLRTFGGNARTAEREGIKLIQRNLWVNEEIKRRSAGRITLADITPERITLELARIAFFDPRKIVNTQVSEDGSTLSENPIPLAMLDEDTARAVKGLKYDVRGNRVLEINDKVAALEKLARVAGMAGPHPASMKAIAGTVDHDSVAPDEIALMLAEFEEDGEIVDMDEDGAMITDDEDGEYE